jgi:pSer/pThr/pTyr-binding forkhead associated (FHA) protein
MKLSLTVLTSGNSAGKSIPITLTQFLIGRDPQCNLRPASAMISKRHCAVLVKGERAFVRDFSSTNGTFVNNEQVQGERELTHEDILKVGPLEFRVMLETTTPVNKPTPTPPPAKPSAAQEDEDVAAMLLSLQDDGGSTPSSTPSSEDIPGGTTVMDMVPGLPPETTEEPSPDAKAAENPEEAGKPPAKKAESKPAPANTSMAAKAILEKYTRRSRS